MRTSRLFALVPCLCFVPSITSNAQQTLPTTEQPAQATAILQKSLTAQNGGAPVADITLTGTVTFIHGTQMESGPMTLTALAAGTTRVAFELPSGTRTEVWSSSNGAPTVTGSGPKGSSTEPAGGNVAMPSPAWFSPVILTSLLSGSGYASSYVGQETRNGTSVHHVSAWQTPGAGSAMPASVARQQTQSEIYLDPNTSIPVSMVFQVRPYQQPGAKPLSIRARPAPEEVRFSDYRQVQGRTVPFHIQLFLGPPPNQQQMMDLTISSAVLNTGATITIPTVAGN